MPPTLDRTEMQTIPRPKVGFVTCSDLGRFFPSPKNPLLTFDDQVAADHLEARGLLVEPLVWGTDPEKVRADFDGGIVIVRSPWDYSYSIEAARAFRQWLGALESHGVVVANPVALMMWNLDKHYLRDLEQQGVWVTPTVYLPSKEKVDLVEMVGRWGEIVVKPCVGAGGRDSFRLQSVSEARMLMASGLGRCPTPFDKLREGRDFMAQPFLKDVLTAGEWSLVFLNSEYTHGVLKLPGSGLWQVQDELGGSTQSVSPPDKVIDAATRVYQAITPAFRAASGRSCPPPLYARVDIIVSKGTPFVGEVELVEPELFFLSRSASGNVPNQAALSGFYAGIRGFLGRIS